MLLDLPVPSADDRDLDLDVRSVRVTNVVRSGDGFVVQAVGRFASSAVAHAGLVTHVDITVEPSLTGPLSRGELRALESELEQLVSRLHAWCDAGTPLRLLAAPGKHLALVDPEGVVVPLPRSA